MYSSRDFVLNSLLISNILSLSAACIFLTDCPDAIKYINKRGNDDKTRTILRNAHCGIGYKNGRQEGKVECDKIPDFKELPDGCIPLSQCNAATQLIRTRKHDEATINLLRSSACAIHIRLDLINCKKVELGVSDKIITNDLSSENCGIEAPSSKIAAGERADFENFPWIALLTYRNETEHIANRCHGSLVNKRYVITAAHCLVYSTAAKRLYGTLHKVILGEYNITSKEDCLPQAFGGYCTDPIQEFLPESIHVHPQFATAGAISDIALIRLNKEAKFSDFVKPICLPQTAISLNERDILHIGGWGKTENRKESEVKLKAKIMYLSKTYCSRYNIDDTQICAGSDTGADTCKGDSGGPLMHYQKTQDGEVRNFLVGIVSLGGKCGSGAAIYTNVAAFNPWIKSIIIP